MPESGLCSIFVTSLLLVPLSAGPPIAGEAETQALAAIQDLRPALGLDARNSFMVRKAAPDRMLGGTDVRMDQYYQGVRVLGGEAIVHLRRGQVRSITHAVRPRLDLDPRPLLTGNEALALALADQAAPFPLTRPPTWELVVARLQPGPDKALRDTLAYRIHTELERGAGATAHTDYLVDACTGAIARKWDTLETGAELSPGDSQYSGTVQINTNGTKKGQELRDLTRGQGGNTVLNLDHDTADSGGDIYVISGATWGDGRNYVGGATTGANGQTAAVDAAYGLQWTWDYYRNIHHRNGIDDQGTATTMRVHYGTAFDNAFWSDSCFCMTFGDGDKLKSLEAMDVMGHEMSHGVCSATAGLEYWGESGGLNESNSDIQGVLVGFYAHSDQPGLIGDQGGDWTIGAKLETPQHPKPIRYMFKPSKDGKSPDAWSEDIGELNVHRSSGPMNRCFYFMSQGASPEKASDFYTSYLPKGMAGIGNDRSARIWYRALVTYLTAFSGYSDARSAAITACKDLYGPGGAEERAVWNAFHGINVGDPWPAAK